MHTAHDGLSDAIYIFSEVPGFTGAVSYYRLAFILGLFSQNQMLLYAVDSYPYSSLKVCCTAIIDINVASHKPHAAFSCGITTTSKLA
jgi:hypothetical protein